MRILKIGIVLLLCITGWPAMAAQPAAKLEAREMHVQVVRARIKDDVSFDDAVESLKLRANQHNLKYVGTNALYKEIEALTGKPSKRMEIFSFCDGLVAQQMIAAEPLMISFMPCRIALLEDKHGGRWVVSMMMSDVMISALPIEVRKSAERIMNAMRDMMAAAANGDL